MLALSSILLCLVMSLIAPGVLDIYHSLLIVTILAGLRGGLLPTGRTCATSTSRWGCSSFDGLPAHHRLHFQFDPQTAPAGPHPEFSGHHQRPLGTDYNVNQAKIAIGSGNFWGKGFLEGTRSNTVRARTAYRPDFIFCTVGEEWGFLGAIVVLSLLCILILCLMRMGERQQEPFGRIYCYCVAAILLFHVLVNVGMTIGLMPVMPVGIPLPFMSYGGSSLIAFTILLFIAVRLDASTRQFS